MSYYVIRSMIVSDNWYGGINIDFDGAIGSAPFYSPIEWYELERSSYVNEYVGMLNLSDYGLSILHKSELYVGSFFANSHSS